MAQSQFMSLTAINSRLDEVKAEVDSLQQTPIEAVSRSRLVGISTELRDVAKQITKQSVSSDKRAISTFYLGKCSSGLGRSRQDRVGFCAGEV